MRRSADNAAEPAGSADLDGLRGAVVQSLLPWFGRHRRDLPWRRRRTPYRVWIAELMLQQTRVETVVGYYRRWMQRFPSLRSLAEASEHDVLKAWEGLGYYRRARNAHRAAQVLVREHGGRFPRHVQGLEALPGIGTYTAAAVGSLAMGIDVAVVDGNVERVLTRLTGMAEEVGRAGAQRALRSLAEGLLVPGRAGECNEAMMELGAMICTPRRPDCPSCPMRASCRAWAEGEPERYPVKASRVAVPHLHVGAGLVVNQRGEVLLAQRPPDRMLGGLWEFPGGRREPGEDMRACVARELGEELGIRVRVGEEWMRVRHAFSHFTMDLHAHWARIDRGRPTTRECTAYAWVEPRGLEAYPMPRADQRIRERMARLSLREMRDVRSKI